MRSGSWAKWNGAITAPPHDQEGYDIMNRCVFCLLGLCLTAAAAAAEDPGGSPGKEGVVLQQRFQQMAKGSSWREVATHAIGFRTFHPQGMTAVGDRFYLSSVEVIDRKADKGIGHLFEIGRTGALLREMTLGEGTMYHPGGIDYDGKRIWVPAAAYHPDSSSIVYTVNPETLRAREVFRFNDHLGAVSHFLEKQLLVAASWGARHFYRWKTVERDGEWTVSDPEHPEKFPNGNHYIDYQDMQRLPGTAYLLCSGLQSYSIGENKLPTASLGGIDLVQVEELRAHHQIPVPLRPALAPAWTQNPFYVETSDTGLRFFFVPEDEKSSIHVFEVEPGR
jgi:hypothetical protein